jgi:hypothetical protein
MFGKSTGEDTWCLEIEQLTIGKIPKNGETGRIGPAKQA